MIIKCPKCGKDISIDEADIDVRFRCESCGRRFAFKRAEDYPDASLPPQDSAQQSAGDSQAEQAQTVRYSKRQWWGPFVSPAGRMKAAVAIWILAAICTVISIGEHLIYIRYCDKAETSQAFQKGLYDENPDITDAEVIQKMQAEGLWITDEECENLNLLSQVVWWSCQGIYILSLVVYLVWLSRAYINLPPLGASETRFTPGTAVAWHFCPFANLWKPCQAINDVWRGSSASELETGKIRSSVCIFLWWFVFLADRFISTITYGLLNSPAEELSVYKERLVFAIGSDVFGVLSIALTIVIIMTISKWQLRRFALLNTSGSVK